MNKKVKKSLLCLLVAFCYSLTPTLTTFAEDSAEVNTCENAIDTWSEEKLRRYSEDNILYYDDQFDNCGEAERDPCDGQAPIDIIPGDNAQSIMNSLKDVGYSNTSVAGIMGNLYAENSTHDPHVLQNYGLVDDDFRLFTNGVRNDLAKSRGLGIAQWTSAGRQQGLQDLADADGSYVTSLKTQIKWLIQELTGSYDLGPAVLNALSMKEASDLILHKYESPKDQSTAVEDKRYGYAQTYYARLTGGETNEETPEEEPVINPDCEPVDEDPDLTPIDEGGLTLTQARQLAINYGANKNDSSKNATGESLWGKCNGGGSNCVTFSAFFVNKFTSHRNYTGNGASFASNIGVSMGTQPQVFSVFQSSGNENGHTGVILGYHDGKYIVGHASCAREKSGAGDGTLGGSGSAFIIEETGIPASWSYHGSKYSNFRFAYLADSVDTNKILEYLQNGE
ncbi:hypothetical protein IJ103_02510 [Candidatus Saccharibacteria bacterium]|nr:hypothetical protein [Candidatus Saccharibacteria bacterium]